jgi:hypothetical protein
MRFLLAEPTIVARPPFILGEWPRVSLLGENACLRACVTSWRCDSGLLNSQSSLGLISPTPDEQGCLLCKHNRVQAP